MNNTLKRLAEPGSRLYLVFLVLFAAATLFIKVYDLDMFTLAMAEGGVILLLIIYTVIMRRRREKQLAAYGLDAASIARRVMAWREKQ